MPPGLLQRTAAHSKHMLHVARHASHRCGVPCHHPARITPRLRSLSAPAAQRDDHVIVLDFDGVLLDSEREIAYAALNAARIRWPSNSTLQGGGGPWGDSGRTRLEEAMERMRDARPVLVRGHESMVMLRLLCEEPSDATVNSILSGWTQLLPDSINRWGEDNMQLLNLYESTRNAFMSSSPEEWMSQQQGYPGVEEALQASPFPVYLATSKAAHRVCALVAARLSFPLTVDDPRLFAALLPPEEAKVHALITISKRHGHRHSAAPAPAPAPAAAAAAARAATAGAVVQTVGGTAVAVAAAVCTTAAGAAEVAAAGTRGPAVVSFVEDRLDTLVAVAEAPELQHVRLYLVDYGYSTAEEREKARLTPGVQLIDITQFLELLRTGQVSQ